MNVEKQPIFKDRHKRFSDHTLRGCRMSLLERRVERTKSGRKRKWISLKNEDIHGFLFLAEYYWSNEIMQDEEEVEMWQVREKWVGKLQERDCL
jgi:hypothetical protein